MLCHIVNYKHKTHFDTENVTQPPKCWVLMKLADVFQGMTARNDIAAVAAFLAKAHPGHACVFDLAEKPNYDKDRLGNCQVG